MKAQKKVEISEYDLQAEKFLADTGTELDVKYTGHRKYFNDEKEHRAVFSVTMKRGDKEISFDFGNSIVESWSLDFQQTFFRSRKEQAKTLEPLAQGQADALIVKAAINSGEGTKEQAGWRCFKRTTSPSAYNVLAAVEKHDPETFTDFCDNYGYSTDSIKALGIFQACQKQYRDLTMLFTLSEMEQLQEIQ